MRIRKIPTPRETFDEPWKQIVTMLFEPFLAFFAPETAAEIDWSKAPVFLDKELRRIAKGFGRRKRSTADFLVKVWRKDGGEQWLIIHIELQAQRDATFPERMFLYNVRAYDLYRRPIMSLAVLADRDPSWRPGHFAYDMGSSRTEFAFSAVKLLDWQSRLEELERSANPFALAVLAHLNTQATRGDSEQRLQSKLRLARLLFNRRWKRNEIDELFQFLDWIMTLPEDLEDRFEKNYVELERRQTMAQTMPPIIKRAHDRGHKEGIEEGIEIGKQDTLVQLLTLRFGSLPEEARSQIERITEIAELDRMIGLVLDAQSLSDVLPSEGR